ncbi:MAG: aldo/keto reductase [Spirochaetaceae bacterium]|jgi:predicted aldo/keto reductase-like oxidoreductase|nr:aldo/keto reductase [Spirochaetaceae bacterium]
MQYRKYGKLGYEVSAFGVGCMRLPREDGDKSKVNREKAYEILRYAADNGVTYFDTAWGYHHKTSEEILGEALEENGRRAKVKIATKQPVQAAPENAGTRKNLELTLKKLRTSWIDVYIIHNIGPNSWEEVKRRNLIGEWEKFKSEGLIKAIGFSYHGGAECFNEVLDYYDWDMCQIQQNLLDVNSQATEKAIFKAGKKNCALVIMEPLRGGGLANPAKAVAGLYDAYPVKRRPVEWAFRHLINYPEVSCILSGVSTMEQLKDDIAIFSEKDAVPGCLSEADKALIAKVRQSYESVRSIPCTGCEYCLPCPQNVQIPNAFSLYNDGMAFENFDQPSRAYSFSTAAKSDASFCVECGLCEEKCPQHIEIPEQLKIAHEKLKGWIE